MTIIELVIAFAILMAVLVPIAILLGNTLGQAASSRERLTALSLAEQYLEKLNNTPVLKHTATTAPTAHAALETTNDPTVPKTSATIKITSLVRSTIAYSIYARFTWALHESSTLDLCTSGTAPTLLDLQVTVEWGRDQQKITDTTLINFPATGILTEGFLAINVYGDPIAGPPKDAQTHPWSTRVKAVPVTISPGATVTTGFTTITRHPNQYGCVFQEVPAGTYTVKVADPTTGTPPGTRNATPSWASSDDELLGETTPSPATVTVGEVATVTFQYDQGAMAKVTYPSTTVIEGPVWCPGVGAIDCLAAGQSPASTKAPSTAPTAVLSVLSSSGWNVYKTAATRLVASACAKRCISVGTTQTGTGAHGAAVSTSTSTVNFTPGTVPTGVSSLTGITCTTTATCYAYGSGGSGAVVLTATVSATSVSWRSGSGLSGVASVQSLDCPKKTTCYAAAATATGPAILSLSGGTWVHDTLPTAVTAVIEVACRTSVCFAIGSGPTGAVVLSQKVTSPTTWVEDTIPPASSLAAVDCLSGTQCYAIGQAASGPTIDSVSRVTGTTVTWTADTFASTPKLSSLTVLECRGTSTCVATGTTSTGPAIVSLYTSTSTWRADGIPTGVTAVTSLACSSGTQCEAGAVATVTGAPGAVVLSLSSTKGTWATDTFPAGTDPLYLAGVACSAKASICAAPGATATGAVLLSSTLSGTTWQRAAPNGVTGMYVGDTPIAVYNPGLSPTKTVEVASPTPTTGDVGSIGPLFPFSSGYQVGATACAAGITSTAPSVTSVPGTTFTGNPTGTRVPTAALPMGLLPIEVLSRTGAPVAGATVTLKPTCTRLPAPPGQSDQTSFALGTTDGSGTTGLAVMYGTYVVTVNYGSTAPVTATVTVSKTSITVGTTTTALPSPGVIRL